LERAQVIAKIIVSIWGCLVELLSTVAGHRSELAVGFLGKNKVPVVAMLGRVNI